MAEKKKAEQSETKQPEKQETPYYQVKTERGVFQARKHTYNGSTFVQTEMDSDGFEQFGEMLIEADIFSVVKLNPDNTVNVDPGIVISHIFRKRMIKPFLRLLLTNEDGTNVSDAQLKGSAGSYVALFKEVAEGFFTMNPALIEYMQMLFTQVVGGSIAAGRLIAVALDGLNSSGRSQNTGQKRTT